MQTLSRCRSLVAFLRGGLVQRELVLPAPVDLMTFVRQLQRRSPRPHCKPPPRPPGNSSLGARAAVLRRPAADESSMTERAWSNHCASSMPLDNQAHTKTGEHMRNADRDKRLPTGRHVAAEMNARRGWS